MDLKKALYSCYEFIMQRKTQEGGFTATPSLHATVEDTYQALKTVENLKMFDLDIDYKPNEDEALKVWLFQNRKWQEPKVFYQFLIVCMLCNIEMEKDFLKQSMDLLILKFLTIERAFYLTKISELINHDIPSIKKLSIPKVVKDLWMFVYLVERGIVKKKLKKQKLIEYLRKCQNPDGGFGFLPNTTSYMDNIYFCLKALRFLGSEPKNPEDALNFILFCQNKTGGFARTPHAAAFLDSTFYAAESLRLLLLK